MSGEKSSKEPYFDQTRIDFAGTRNYGANDAAQPGFVCGTSLLSARGWIPVEHLVPGDRLSLLHGGTAPIVSIRRLDRRSHGELPRPIVLRAGTLGPYIPRRDLLLGPDHAVYINNFLIPAHLLSNATGPEQPYFHIELPHHEIVKAEGAPTENASTRDRPYVPYLKPSPTLDAIRTSLRARKFVKAR